MDNTQPVNAEMPSNRSFEEQPLDRPHFNFGHPYSGPLTSSIDLEIIAICCRCHTKGISVCPVKGECRKVLPAFTRYIGKSLPGTSAIDICVSHAKNPNSGQKES